ncbi:MAG TPA: PilZ domain-containing protein [Bryobacteraceae bacterium]|nr:PilZ domain-containing protein [Bryobacteraceae bacterium]
MGGLNPILPTGRLKQRRHSRFPADLALQVNAMRGTRVEPGTGRVLDVSEGGLAFVGTRYLPPGTVVNVEIGDCRLMGDVRHCRMREYASHVQFVTGVRIQQILDGQESWKRLLRG